MTEDDLGDFPGPGGLELGHDVQHGPVGAVPQVGIDPVLQQRLDHLHLAAESRLVQGRASGGADVDVHPDPEKLYHHVTVTVPGRKVNLESELRFKGECFVPDLLAKCRGV